MSNTLDQLKNVIVPAISGPDRAYCVTVACKSTDGDGEDCHIASALGRLTSATFTIEVPTDFDDALAVATKEAVDRVKQLIDAGIFADIASSEEFPHVPKDERTLSFHITM